jgi:hypothetical protein
MRRYRAERLAASGWFCPACRHRLETADIQRCPACDFTGSATMRLFPFPAPEPVLLGDYAGLFTARDTELLDRCLQGFGRKFPQFGFSIVTADLAPELDLRLFAFWLLNVMPVPEGNDPKRREWLFLLVVRPDFEMALAAGYSAEVWISESDWAELLKKCRRRAQAGAPVAALEGFLDEASLQLEAKWKRLYERRRSSRVKKRRR